MGSPIDVVPGEIIEAEWGNIIRDQTISRWPDATARDDGLPIPDAGKVVWLDTPGTLEVYDGAEWVGIDILYGGPFLPLAGGTVTGRVIITDTLEVAPDPDGDGRPRQQFNAAADGLVFHQTRQKLVLGQGTSRVWLTNGVSGDLGDEVPNDATNPFVVESGGRASMWIADTGGAQRVLSFRPRRIGDTGTGIYEWRMDNDGLKGLTPNTSGTSILEYLRVSKSGTTPRVSYRGSASTSTAAANATWFTSNEITSGSRSIGQAALAQGDHIAPATLAELEVATDPVVSALASVPIRRAAYAPGYLTAGDPREGVAHPMILADELEAIAPEMVDRLPVFDEDGIPGPDDLVVNGPVMTAALLAYVRSLEERIANLESGP